MAAPGGIVDLGPASPDEPYDDAQSRRSYPTSSRPDRQSRGSRRDRDRDRYSSDSLSRDRDRGSGRDRDRRRGGDRGDRDRDRDRDRDPGRSRRDRDAQLAESRGYYSDRDRDGTASAYAPSEAPTHRSTRSHRSRRDRDIEDDRRSHRGQPLEESRDLPIRPPPVGDIEPRDERGLAPLSQELPRDRPRTELVPHEAARSGPGNELGMPLPQAYYEEPQQALRRRDRSYTPSPPRRTTTRKGDILSAVAGAAVATAADKYVIEPRMKSRGGDRGRRSKSQGEYIRRAADIGVGAIGGTAAYRAISRSRARSKAKKRRDDSLDSRGRGDSRDGSRDRSRSKGIPWKALIGPAAGGLAGLVAEQVGKSRENKNNDRDDRSRGGRSDYSDDSRDDMRSRDGRDSGRRHSSADAYGKSRRQLDYSSDEDYDRRDRRRRRDDRRSIDSRPQNPHHTRDLVEEAIGLLGVAQGLRGKDKGAAAVKTAIGAYGIASDYYTRHKAQQQAAGGRAPRPSRY